MNVRLPLIAVLLVALAASTTFLALQQEPEVSDHTDCEDRRRMVTGTGDGHDSLNNYTPFYPPRSTFTVSVLVQPCPAEVEEYRWYFGGPGGIELQTTATTEPSQTFRLEHIGSHTVVVDLVAPSGEVLWHGIEHAWFQPQVRYEETAVLSPPDGAFSWQDSVVCCPNYLRTELVRTTGAVVVPFQIQLLDEDGTVLFEDAQDLEVTLPMFRDVLGDEWRKTLQVRATPLTVIPPGHQFEIRFQVETIAYDLGLP